jgi:hypothetical protein
VDLGLRLVAADTSPTQAAVRAEVVARMRSALGLLRDADRAVIQLRGYDNLSFAETGELLGVGENTATDAASLSFNFGAGAFQVRPNPDNLATLRLGSGGLTVQSNANQTISAPLALGANQTWANHGAGATSVTGAVTATGMALTVAGAATAARSAPSARAGPAP